jgi:hypothetical protein
LPDRPDDLSERLLPDLFGSKINLPALFFGKNSTVAACNHRILCRMYSVVQVGKHGDSLNGKLRYFTGYFHVEQQLCFSFLPGFQGKSENSRAHG